MKFKDNLSLTPGGTNDYHLGANTLAGTDYDQVLVEGTLNVNGVQWSDFNFTTNSGFGEGAYVLMHATTLGVSTLGASVNGFIGSEFAGVLSLSGNDLLLTVTPAPIQGSVYSIR